MSTAIVLTLATTAALQAQTRGQEPEFDGRPLSAWVEDLKAAAPQTRNAAAYVISGMGPAARAAVPALIEALDDPVAAVRYPVAVALREIGPAAAAAVPALRRALNDSSDDVAAMARKALIAITGEDPGPPED
jgi:HEAT repeat protein